MASRAGGSSSRPWSVVLLFVMQLTVALAANGCGVQLQVFLSPSGSDAHCCGSAASPCGTLHRAVARTAPNGTIFLHSGVHRTGGKEVSFNGTNISIQAMDLSAPTVVDCQHGPCLVSFCPAKASCIHSTLSLVGFTIRNGKSSTQGGCVDILNQNLFLRNMSLTGCYAEAFGGAISVVGASASISSVTITNSNVTSSYGGGGAMSLNLTHAILTNVNIHDCSAGAGIGGGIATFLANLRLSDSSITHCSAQTQGGGVNTGNSTVVIERTRFEHSQASYGGCYGDSNSNVTIDDSQFISCIADSPSNDDFTFGGGVYLSYSIDVSMRGCYVYNCSSVISNGGGVYVAYVTSFVMEDSVFEANTVISNGAGFFGTATPITIQSCQFLENSILFQEGFGAGITLFDCPTNISDSILRGNFAGITGSSQGGGMYVVNTSEGSMLHGYNVTFQNNSAVSGGGFYTDTVFSHMHNCSFIGNYADSLGGAVLLINELDSKSTETIIFDHCHFTGNSGGQGGALYIPTSYAVTIRGSTLHNNSAAIDGGAIYIPGRVTTILLEDTIFVENSAPTTRGGAIFLTGSLLAIKRCNFIGNVAGIKGGALAVQGGQTNFICNLTVDSSTFVGNQSPLGGGGIYSSLHADTIVHNCTFTSNNSTSGGAILLEDFGNLNMTSSFCNNNNASNGGGCILATDMSNVTLTDCELLGNEGVSGGGAFRLIGEAKLVTTNCSFVNNSASAGGAGSTEMTSHVYATGCNFSHNDGVFHGGAIYGAHQSHLILSNCRFLYNRAFLGGAMLMDGNSLFDVTNSTFLHNDDTALVFQGQSKGRLTQSLIQNNTAGMSTGGGVYLSEEAVVNVTESTFSCNAAMVGGGLCADSQSSVTVARCQFVENNAKQGGALAAVGTSSVFATGCFFDSNFVQREGAGAAFLGASKGGIANSVFSSNVAGADGAGVYIERAPVSPGMHIKALQMVNLTFDGNKAPRSQGVAYFEASYDPVLRTTCKHCVKVTAADTMGTLPTSFHMKWPGSVDRSSKVPFRVLGSVGQPVLGLTLDIQDAFGSVAVQDNASVAEISPDPRISGLLRSVAKQGIIGLPPINILTNPEAAVDFNLNVTLSSPGGFYPDIVRKITIGLCRAGTYYSSKSFECLPCELGSWCAAGQLMKICPDDYFSFQRGASSAANCSSCSSEGLLCLSGKAFVKSGYWLSPPSVNSSKPTAFNCLYNGCSGFEYTGPNYTQCSATFTENRMCSTCADKHFFLLQDCHHCGSVFSNIFPLLIALVVVAWISMNILSDTFDTINIFVNEVQTVTMIGSYNLNYPKWVLRVLQYFNLSLFEPDIIGPECRLSYPYERRWSVAILVPVVGCIVYLCFYLKHRWTSAVRRRAAAAAAALESESAGLGISATMELNRRPGRREHDKESDVYNNRLVHSITNWLDICYVSVLIRCFQVFQRQVYDEAVIGSAPQIVWASRKHTVLLAVGVVVTAIYLLGVCILYTAVLVYGNAKGSFQDTEFKQRYSWMFNLYKPEYWWWHLTNILRRVVFSGILVFASSQPSVQIALTLPIQAVRIGLQYASSPFVSSSLDWLNAALILGEFFFTLAMTAYNYIGLLHFSQGLFVIAVTLIVGPIITTFCYEAVNKALVLRNNLTVTAIWRRKTKGKLIKSHLAHLPASSRVPITEICQWLRPHVAYCLTLPHNSHEHDLLLKVKDRYEQCKLEGLGPILWIRHLSKPQLYAVLAQALLGAGAGNMVIARVPLRGNFCSDHGNWHEEGEQHPMLTEIETPTAGVRWPPRLERHVSWCMEPDDPVARHPAKPVPIKSSTPRSRTVAPVDDGDDIGPVMATPLATPSIVAQSPTPTPTSLQSRRRDEVAAPSPGLHGGADASTPAGQDTAKPHILGRGFRRPPPLDLPQNDEDGPVGSEAAPSAGPGAGATSAGRLAGSTGFGPEYPEHLFVRTGIAEARMNMAELTLTFQRHLAMLVKAESRKSAESLRLLVRSQAISHILAWLTAPTSTEEDQKLLRDLFLAARNVTVEETGSLGWRRGIWCFFKNAYWGRQKSALKKRPPPDAKLDGEEEKVVGTPRNI